MKINVSTWLVVGLMAITFIVFTKMLVGGTFLKNVPGVSDVVTMA